VGLDGCVGFTDGAVAMAELLVEAPVIGMHGLEPGQCLQGVRDAAEVALAHCDEVQHVAVLGYLAEQRLRDRQGLGEPSQLGEPPRALHLGLDARRRRYGLRCDHDGASRAPPGTAQAVAGQERKGGHRGPPWILWKTRRAGTRPGVTCRPRTYS